jgi:hypothetical protein
LGSSPAPPADLVEKIFEVADLFLHHALQVVEQEAGAAVFADVFAVVVV